MSEWWTYRPSDFLMFAPRTYWRLFELHNEAWWPLQWVLLAAGLGWTAWLAKTRSALALRIGAAGLAGVWAFVAYSFVLQRYAPINWAATWLAAGLAGLSAALALLATRADLRAAEHPGRRGVGLSIIGAALLLYPLLGIASGRPLKQAEVFGLAPDPTALATLGWLIVSTTTDRTSRVLVKLSVTLTLAWCAASAATRWTMGQ